MDSGGPNWNNFGSMNTINLPARTLYLWCGFHVVGLRRRALRIGDRYFDEEMTTLDLR